MRRTHRRNDVPYPRHLGRALLIPLLLGLLGAAAPAAAQRPGACDQYIPNCEPPGDDPRGNEGGQPSAGSPESSLGPGDSISPAQSTGGTEGDGGVGDNSEGTAATAGDRGTADSGGGGPAALSVAANAGEGDAGGGGLVGTDYPVTGWMVVAGALLLGLAVLLLVRYGWAAVRRGGGAATG